MGQRLAVCRGFVSTLSPGHPQVARPVDLRDKEIQLRYDRRRNDTAMSTTAVVIYHKGQRMGAARLLDTVANGLLRRKEQP